MKTNYLESAEVSDLGRKRKNNEDTCLRLPENGVFCVADGMGGVVGGDLASEAITTSLREVFNKAAAEDPSSLAGRIRLFKQAADQASKWIKNYADEKVLGQMGSTVVAVVFDPCNPARAIGLHAGDSRLYRYREGKLTLLTSDHTAVAALSAKLGRDPSSLPARYQNELTRAVGLNESVELEQTMIDVRSADLFLLCSDGLTHMVPDEDLARILERGPQKTASALAQALVNAANEAGGRDNVTVVLVRVGDISGLAIQDEPEDEFLMVAAAAESSEPKAAPAPGHPTDRAERHETPDTYRGDTPQTEERTPDKTITISNQAAASAIQEPIADGSRKGRFLALTTTIALLTIGVAGAGTWFFLHSKPSTHVALLTSTPAMLPSTNPNASAPALSRRDAKSKMPPPAPIAVTAAVSQPIPISTSNGPSRNSLAVTSAPPPVLLPALPPTGSVVIHTEPSGARVFRQGERLGETPYEAGGVPAGVVAYSLGNLTHTGTVALTVTAGQATATNVILTTRFGTAKITSYPIGAEVFLDAKRLGATPALLRLPAGQHLLMIKYPDLPDLALSLAVGADQVMVTNLVLPYARLEVRSEPPGAQVWLRGQAVGVTPYTNLVLSPGPVTLQIKLKNYVDTNYPFNMGPRTHNMLNFPLRRGLGTLALKCNVPGVKAWLDGKMELPTLPTNIKVEAGSPHVVRAEYGGQQQTKTNSLDIDETRNVVFTFSKVEPAPKPKSATGLQMWTNILGMVFAELPEHRFWVETARVTPDQYQRAGGVLPNGANGEDDGQPCLVNIACLDASRFAETLTAQQKAAGHLPPGYEGGHFALPTTNQWIEIANHADALGIRIKTFTRCAEWTLAPGDKGNLEYGGRWVTYKNAPEFKSSFASQPERMTFRLMLVK